MKKINSTAKRHEELKNQSDIDTLSSLSNESLTKSFDGNRDNDPSKNYSGTFGGNTEEIKEVFKTTFAGKKSKFVFYTQRKIILYTDGSFAYKSKNKNKIKLFVPAQNIKKLDRKNNILKLKLD